MIQPQELRIGNWVEEINPLKIEERFHIVKGVLDSGKDNFGIVIATNIETYSVNEFAPIPLTEEWLLKFEFETQKDDFFFRFYKGDFLFNTKRMRLAVSIDVGNRNNGYKDLSDIQYVHQLQNLYFALVGKELEVK